MPDLRFEFEWFPTPDAHDEHPETRAHLSIHAGSLCLTRNEDLWLEKIQDSILVSLYPLAEWLAASWWRLGYEPLPPAGVPHDWRMSHEIAAVGGGFAWPTVVFATDGEAMQIWSTGDAEPDAMYVGPSSHVSTPISQFQACVSGFVEAVLARLAESGGSEPELAELWRLVQAERADASQARLRRLEARLGYDPEECPERLLAEALVLEASLGKSALAELAAAYARQDADADVPGIGRLVKEKGLVGAPQVSGADFPHPAQQALPWQEAVAMAGQARRFFGAAAGPIADADLYGFLGLQASKVRRWSPTGETRAAVAGQGPDGKRRYVSRKRHPIAKRFEFARFIADEIHAPAAEQPHWLVATDLATSRQKFQRAFAAEFLCPIESLVAYLDDDFSETAIENAAEHFAVSDQAVKLQLSDRGYLDPRYPAAALPYSLAARPAGAP